MSMSNPIIRIGDRHSSAECAAQCAWPPQGRAVFLQVSLS